MKHALITGGAGFIGSYLARFLLDDGYKVTVVDNLSNGSEENIPKGCNFINIDIATEHWVDLLDPSIDYVFHLAAQSSGEISFEDPENDLKINTLGTLTLLNWSLNNGIKKFIFTSSMNVYGQVEDRMISEKDYINPDSFYAVGKVASENYMRIYSDLGLNITVLRLFNVYGPGQNLHNLKQGMISIYCAYMHNNDPILVKGSLNRFRDFVYITDVIDAISQSMHHDLNFLILNVCTGVKTTVGDVISMMRNSSSKSDYPITVLDGTPRDQFGIYGNPSLAKTLIGWESKINIRDGMENMIKWIGNLDKGTYNE